MNPAPGNSSPTVHHQPGDRDARSAPKTVTLAIPLFNEEANLPELRRRVTSVVDQLDYGPHEILLVDDGSTDATAALCLDWSKSDPRVRLLRFSRNFGHQPALTAALDHALGDVVVILDGDLQDPPEAVPRFIAEYRRGYDVVFAQRTKRKEGVVLRFCYYVFYRLIRSLSDTPLPLDSGDCALLARPVVDAMNLTGERGRYLRGIRTWVGFRQLGIRIEREQRHAGTPKYGPIKLLRLALDGIFSFTLLPLRAASMVGFTAVVCSLAYWIYAAWVRLTTQGSPAGFTALASAIVFLAGVQLLFLGVIGEYVGRIYTEVKARPTYVLASDSSTSDPAPDQDD